MRPDLQRKIRAAQPSHESAQLIRDRALAVLPGGVNSPVRAWNGVGGEFVALESGRGAYVTDVTGRRFVDLVGSWGASIVGHAHPEVVDAVTEAASKGLSFGATTEAEVELAEEICARYAPAERVRLVSTGTEATMTAVRIARAATGRDLVVKFEGCYHGHSDSLLVAAGSGLATAGIPDSAGVTSATAAQTLVLPYGDVEALEQAFAELGSRIATVITEAAPANMGVIEPPAGFNAAIARLCGAHSSVFVVDEVLTGFRAGPQGWWGIERDRAAAEGREPWTPDLVTFGKVIGGGMPVAAVAGRTDLMEQLAPVGRVYQAGTLSGNPVAVAAGVATLRLLDDAAYATLGARADDLAASASAALDRSGIPHVMARAGTLMSPFLGLTSAPQTFEQAQAQDTTTYARLFHGLFERGVWAPPSAFEAWFVSTAHTEADIEWIANSIADAARSIAREAGS